MSLRKAMQWVLLKTSALLDPPVWEGIYQQPSEIPSEGPGFEGPEWTAESEAALQALRQSSSSPSFFPKRMNAEHLLLPFLLSILAQEKSNIRVLDFGGGYGLFYEQIKQSVSDLARVEYHIMDTSRVCERAAKWWTNELHIQFHPDWPRLPSAVDVLFLSSSLQYVDDYPALLARLCRDYAPRYVLFVKLSAGDFPTYVTAQKNLEGSVIPYRFINARELVEAMQKNGYRLLYKSTLEKTYFQGNFPKTHRMGKTGNLLFLKS